MTELTLGGYGALTGFVSNSYNIQLSGLIEHPMDCSGVYYGDLIVDDRVCGGD